MLHNPHAISARWVFHGIGFSVFVSFDMDMQQGPIATTSNYTLTVDGTPRVLTTVEVISERILFLNFAQPNLNPDIVSVKSLALLGELLSVPGLQADLFDLPALLLPDSSQFFYEDGFLLIDVFYGSHMDVGIDPLPGDFVLTVNEIVKTPIVPRWDNAHGLIIDYFELGLTITSVNLVYTVKTPRVVTTWGTEGDPFDINPPAG